MLLPPRRVHVLPSRRINRSPRRGTLRVVPQIKLEGPWINSLGWQIGDYLLAQSPKPGILVLTVDPQPPPRPAPIPDRFMVRAPDGTLSYHADRLDAFAAGERAALQDGGRDVILVDLHPGADHGMPRSRVAPRAYLCRGRRWKRARRSSAFV